MAQHAYIAFVEGEKGLNAADPEFRDLVRELYKIKGCGSHGVSCAGHVEERTNCRDVEEFSCKVYGHLQMALLPELSHIPPLIKLIDDYLHTDSDSRITVEIDTPPYKYPVYEEGVDLRPFKLWETKDGLYVVKLNIRMGDGGIKDDIEERTGERYGHWYLKVEGLEDIRDRCRVRGAELIALWDGLEAQVADYNDEHGFTEIELKKTEFDIR